MQKQLVCTKRPPSSKGILNSLEIKSVQKLILTYATKKRKEKKKKAIFFLKVTFKHYNGKCVKEMIDRIRALLWKVSRRKM